ncbi:MAG: nickel/cobalt transporter [Salinarimonadaceae bacterium]|nr:MAG: nickel/cobalt transporter [Salinarimonadaceae bacterium]
MTGGLASARSRTMRLLVALAAAAVAAAGLYALLAFALPEPPASRAPFGMSGREAGPRGDSLSVRIIAIQAVFHQHLQGALQAMRADPSALWTLVAVGFGYGVFHAAGPGHGKAVISAYLVADEKALRKGFALCLAAALLQALVAITLVVGGAALFSATASGMTRASERIELVSFAFVALLGLWLTWRKAGSFVAIFDARPGGAAASATCDHVHMPGPADFARARKLRDHAAIVFAAGLRPCAGALVILAFALSQGMVWAGIAATFAMAAGTALTTGIIAAMAVGAKTFALRVAGGRARLATITGATLELAAAAFVLVVGLALLTGLIRIGFV